jgi:hypothetical protein
MPDMIEYGVDAERELAKDYSAIDMAGAAMEIFNIPEDRFSEEEREGIGQMLLRQATLRMLVIKQS